MAWPFDGSATVSDLRRGRVGTFARSSSLILVADQAFLPPLCPHELLGVQVKEVPHSRTLNHNHTYTFAFGLVIKEHLLCKIK